MASTDQNNLPSFLLLLHLPIFVLPITQAKMILISFLFLLATMSRNYLPQILKHLDFYRSWCNLARETFSITLNLAGTCSKKFFFRWLGHFYLSHSLKRHSLFLCYHPVSKCRIKIQQSYLNEKLFFKPKWLLAHCHNMHFYN